MTKATTRQSADTEPAADTAPPALDHDGDGDQYAGVPTTPDIELDLEPVPDEDGGDDA
jgi:hypothetical protein